MSRNNKIPKVIHWCWLSGEPVPPFLRACMESWKRQLPDYRLRCWTQADFDVDSVPWVAQAVARRKWAFAADYIRLYALYTEGGIYLDSDVEVLRPFDRLLRYDFFSGAEFGSLHYKYIDVPVDKEGIPYDRDAFVPVYGIQAAIMGAAKGNSFIRECMDFYEDRNFAEPDGRLHTDLTMPLVVAKTAERHGFRYLDKTQRLRGSAGEELYIGRNSLLPSAINLLRPGTMAFHHCAGSWLDTKKKPVNRVIGRRLLPLALKYAAKTQWWKFRKWRRRHSGGTNPAKN